MFKIPPQFVTAAAVLAFVLLTACASTEHSGQNLDASDSFAPHYGLSARYDLHKNWRLGANYQTTSGGDVQRVRDEAFVQYDNRRYNADTLGDFNVGFDVNVDVADVDVQYQRTFVGDLTLGAGIGIAQVDYDILMSLPDRAVNIADSQSVFGVVTSIGYRLHPKWEVAASNRYYPLDHTFDAYRVFELAVNYFMTDQLYVALGIKGSELSRDNSIRCGRGLFREETCSDSGLEVSTDGVSVTLGVAF